MLTDLQELLLAGFNLKAQIAKRQIRVDEPKTGSMAIIIPTLTAQANLDGEMPCFKTPTSGSINFLFRNTFIGEQQF